MNLLITSYLTKLISQICIKYKTTAINFD